MGSKIGTMLKVDPLTSIHWRGRFARICVEIDLRRKLVPKFKVLSYEYALEYEGLHLICFNCGKYGHRSEQCCAGHQAVEHTPAAMQGGGGELIAISVEDGNQMNKEGPDVVEKISENDKLGDMQGQDLRKSEQPIFGPWMLVKRTPRRRQSSNDRGRIIGNQFPINQLLGNAQNDSPQNKEQSNGSRFNALTDDMDINEELNEENPLDMNDTEDHNIVSANEARSTKDKRIPQAKPAKGAKGSKPTQKAQNSHVTQQGTAKKLVEEQAADQVEPKTKDKNRPSNMSKFEAQIWHSFRQAEKLKWKEYKEGQNFEDVLAAHKVDNNTLMNVIQNMDGPDQAHLLKPPDPPDGSMLHGSYVISGCNNPILEKADDLMNVDGNQYQHMHGLRVDGDYPQWIFECFSTLLFLFCLHEYHFLEL